MTLRPRHHHKSLAFGTTLAGLLLASFAFAADAGPIDKASGQVSEALAALKEVTVGNKNGDEHLDKARTLLARAKVELLRAQEQPPKE